MFIRSLVTMLRCCLQAAMHKNHFKSALNFVLYEHSASLAVSLARLLFDVHISLSTLVLPFGSNKYFR